MNERNQNIYADYFGGMTLQSVAEKYGLTRQRVEQIVVKIGPKRERINGGMKNRVFDYGKIAEFYSNNTATLGETAKNFGCSVSTVRYALSSAGVETKNRKFTKEIVGDIVSRYQAGEKLRLIGESYQVSPQHINTILRRSGVSARRRVKGV